MWQSDVDKCSESKVTIFKYEIYIAPMHNIFDQYITPFLQTGVEIGSGQSAYLGKMGHFCLGHVSHQVKS